MSTRTTTNARLFKPAAAERNWDVPINANADFLDGVSAIGRLLVTPVDSPGASPSVRVTAGVYRRWDGSVAEYAGTESFPVTPSSMVFLWLTDGGQLSASDQFPTTPHVRLARVSAGASVVESIQDERVCLVSAQASGVAPGSGGPVGVGPSSGQFGVNPSTGLAVISVVADVPALGFFGATPSTQAPKVASIQDTSMGMPADSVESIGSIAIDNNFATLTAKVNALIEVLQRHGLMGR